MCKLKWKDCITFPNEWKVKTESDLIDPEQDSSLLPKNAKIQIMARYIPIGQQESNFNTQGEPSKKVAQEIVNPKEQI